MRRFTRPVRRVNVAPCSLKSGDPVVDTRRGKGRVFSRENGFVFVAFGDDPRGDLAYTTEEAARLLTLDSETLEGLPGWCVAAGMDGHDLARHNAETREGY
jgi:hypothetical protein